MKKTFSLLTVTLFFGTLSFACTTFFINKNGQMVFGRNYDWFTGNGMVCTNQRGLAKTSSKTKDGETISWVAAYGSITFNQYGKEFPTGGMNEKGLVVELMWLDGTKYPDADRRPAVGVLQWIQYHLDNCATVDELIASDKKIRIASKGTTPLHYLVADATGNVAVIEFLEGKMKVHKGKDLPFAVLTNDKYISSLELTKTSTITGGGNSMPFTSNSIDRFAKACNSVTQFQQAGITGSAIDYSFAVLDNVAQGSHTKWSIVYDITNKKIYFKTLGFPAIKNVAFAGFDFTCMTTSKAWDMNQAGEGDVTKLFGDFSLAMNSRIVNRSFDESTTEFTVSEEGRKETWQYPGNISCPKSSN
ncbi:MAG: linear amide C-N hydrolase [Ferruginibacter sp.]|nr:linear amide C-N hydrolase [Chitinophagaceae bacterium]